MAHRYPKGERGVFTSKGREQQGPGIETTPHYPETTPPLTPSSDYTYVLDAVMHMRQSMGQLIEAVGTLKESRTEHTQKFDAINEKLEKINRTIYAATLIITIAAGFLGVFGKSILDRVFPLSPAVQQAAPAPVALPQPTQQPTPIRKNQ